MVEKVTPRESDIYLIAGFNEGYLRKAMDYLETMNCYSNVNNIIITLDFDVTVDLREKLNNIKFVRINSQQVQSPNPNKCLQHGAFLGVVDFISDDSIIIYTDTDIIIQRPFDESELKLLGDCQDGDVFVNPCMPEGQTLLKDTEISPPNIAISKLMEMYPEISTFDSYNTGVICTNCRTYKRMYDMYNQYWPTFSPLFDAHVKQQFLLTYIIQKHFHFRPLPDVIHSHAFSMLIEKCSDKKPGYIGEAGTAGYKLCIGSKMVVFKHHIKHESLLDIYRLRKKVRLQYRIISLLVILIIVFLMIALA